MRYALMLTFILLASLAVGIGTTGAQETRTTDSVGVFEQTADLSLSVFRERRWEKLHRVNTFRERLGRSARRFGTPTNEIAPDRRDNNLAYWNRTVRTNRDIYRMWTRRNNKFHRAARYSARTFNISYNWLHNCAHTEGGHGGFVMNNQGSGAGGWMQFMSSTFYSFVDPAWRSARRRGETIPKVYKNWHSRLGQAVTAGYMFSTGRAYHWTGSGC